MSALLLLYKQDGRKVEQVPFVTREGHMIEAIKEIAAHRYAKRPRARDERGVFLPGDSVTKAQLGSEFGVRQTTISEIVRGKIWGPTR